MIEANLNSFTELISPRLRLRPLEAEDRQEIFLLRSDHRVNRYLDREPAHTIQDAINFIDKINTSLAKNQSFYWAICLKENPRLIGTICLYNISIKSSTAELGYELNPFYQGKGIMQEAVNTVLAFSFDEVKLQSIIAVPSKDNISSIRLLERAGFKLDDSFVTEPSMTPNLEFVAYRLDSDSKND